MSRSAEAALKLPGPPLESERTHVPIVFSPVSDTKTQSLDLAPEALCCRRGTASPDLKTIRWQVLLCPG